MATKKTPIVVDVEVTTKTKKTIAKTEIDETPTAIKPPKIGSLAAMIIAAANNKCPYRNEKGMTMLDNKTRKKLTDEEYEKIALHRDICRELVRLSTENENFPYTCLVYIAVGTDAHKKPIFDKGYKTINTKKAETIIRWLSLFAKYNKNPKFYTCDKIVHAFVKLYDSYSKKDKDFRTLMNQFNKLPASSGFKASQFKTMQQFYELFTKPLIATIEVDETTGKESVVSVKPNPLASKKTAAASCTALVLYEK